MIGTWAEREEVIVHPIITARVAGTLLVGGFLGFPPHQGALDRWWLLPPTCFELYVMIGERLHRRIPPEQAGIHVHTRSRRPVIRAVRHVGVGQGFWREHAQHAQHAQQEQQEQPKGNVTVFQWSRGKAQCEYTTT